MILPCLLLFMTYSADDNKRSRAYLKLGISVEDAIQSQQEKTGDSDHLFPEKKEIAHLPVFFNGSEVVVRAKHTLA